MLTKNELRTAIRQERRRRSAEECRLWSEELCRAVLANPRVAAANTVVAFAPLPDEADIMPALERLWSEGKRVLLPRVTGATTMELCNYSGSQSLKAGAFGILEPLGEPVPLPGDGVCTVILVPGMAFDSIGHRLGRGRGYYDRFLAITQAYTIGVCLPFQIVASVPCEEHDRKVNELLCTWKTSK